MSSVGRGYAQRQTNKMVNMSNTYGYINPLSYILDALKSLGNGTSIKVSDSQYLIDTSENLLNFISYILTYAGGSQMILGETVTDLGATLRIGLQGGESNMLVFRLVQRSNTTVARYGGGSIGYTIIENNISADPSEETNLIVTVVRTS